VPQTLLLADDSVTIQRVIELTFADEDIDVVAVSDGDQAIARLDAMPPDIVLADVGMPGKSGYEVAAYVKQTPRLAHIPVMLLTGAFEPVDEAKAAAAGCDGVLAKPFEPQMVIGRVKELLGRLTKTALLASAAPPAAATDLWPASTVDPRLAAQGPAASAKKIDDYFDQLDAAFTSLSGKPPADLTEVHPASPVPADVDWFGLKPESTPAPLIDVSMSREAEQPAAWTEAPDLHLVPPPESPVQEAVPDELPSLPSQPPSSLPPAAAPSLPPLADAFAALLAAEHGDAAPIAPLAWPSAVGAAPAVTDDLVERVARRVLEQLTDRVVREAVSDAVSAIAERLVREEIERIKSSIE
jgi:CheY-like chemotaxis protein